MTLLEFLPRRDSAAFGIAVVLIGFVAWQDGWAASTQGAPSTPIGLEWPSFNKSLGGQRYSTLTDINTRNVSTLRETCRLQIAQRGSFQAGPIVVSGTMYVTTSLKTVALDATTCSQKWEYDYSPEQAEVLPNNRGVAYLNGKLFRGTADARLLALDADTGRLLWSDVVGDADIGEFISGAPAAWNGMVFVGTAGSEVGVKGRTCAYDAATGRNIWCFSMIPTGRATGADTWKSTKWVDHGGGGTWSHFALDPVKAEIFIPVGNPVPDFLPSDRPGHNLFTDSVVVLDALTGQLKWWYQLVPHDANDYDLAAAPMLYRDSHERDRVALAGKDGYLHVVDRATHRLAFKASVTTIGTFIADGMKLSCPGILGGVEWNGPAFDRSLHTIAVGSVDYCSAITPAPVEYRTGQLLYGGTISFSKTPAKGWLTAIDSDSGAIRWKFHADSPFLSGITMTAGGLTFAGDNDGNLYAFDTQSGQVLLKKPTGGSISGGIVTYSEGGKQYLAFTSGNVSRTGFGTAGKPTVFVMEVAAVPSSDADADPSRGAKIYGSTCGGCHGPSGSDQSGVTLTGLHKRMNSEQLTEWIVNPLPPMPRTFLTPLNPDDERDLRDLVAYMLLTF